MNRSDIHANIYAWAKDQNITLTHDLCESLVKQVFAEVTMALQSGQNVTIPQLGTFQCKVRKARNGVNPRNGEKVVYPEKTVVKFKLSSTVERPSVKDVKKNAK